MVGARSLSMTVDAVNSAFFDGRVLSKAVRTRVARWIAGRQGLPGAYAGTFAGFPSEREDGIVLFTGERIASASARHILGEESCRALRLLDAREKSVADALNSSARPRGRPDRRPQRSAATRWRSARWIVSETAPHPSQLDFRRDSVR
jgi:hypothetical protein